LNSFNISEQIAQELWIWIYRFSYNWWNFAAYSLLHGG
jgi:hypothetical protein